MELSGCLFSRKFVRNYTDEVTSDEVLRGGLEGRNVCPQCLQLLGKVTNELRLFLWLSCFLKKFK